MKLYVNGDSHSAAAEAVNAHAFAEDDGRYFYMGRAPHPDNHAVSWCKVLANITKSVLHNDSESASSNQRILRTTRQWLQDNQRWWPETVVIVQWSTWERQEWNIDGQWYQINASGIDHVPESHQDRYREFVATVDWAAVTEQAHRDIWQLHQELVDCKIRHVFFNGNNHFGALDPQLHRDWEHCYIDPYVAAGTYDSWLRSRGFTTVTPNSWHFGQAAHAAWANFVLQYGIKHQLWN